MNRVICSLHRWPVVESASVYYAIVRALSAFMQVETLERELQVKSSLAEEAPPRTSGCCAVSRDYIESILITVTNPVV